MKNHFAMAFVAASAVFASSASDAEAKRPVAHHASAARLAKHVKAQQPAAWAGESGTASYYNSKYNGRRMSNGGIFDEHEMTAAHPWLPFGTKVRVALGGGERSVVVTITDRLYSGRRVVDLSRAAAEQLGIIQRGVAKVSLSPV
jgi:rare lipoprotein A